MPEHVIRSFLLNTLVQCNIILFPAKQSHALHAGHGKLYIPESSIESLPAFLQQTLKKEVSQIVEHFKPGPKETDQLARAHLKQGRTTAQRPELARSHDCFRTVYATRVSCKANQAEWLLWPVQAPE